MHCDEHPDHGQCGPPGRGAPADSAQPHIATHTRQQFVDTNIGGTLNLLEEAVAAGVTSFVLTSSTSVFGHALRPADGEPSRWITEEAKEAPARIVVWTDV